MEPAQGTKVILECLVDHSFPFLTRVLDLNYPIMIGAMDNRHFPAANNAIFESKVLSFNHAFLCCMDGKFYLGDNESKHGTYVNAERLQNMGDDTPLTEVFTNDILQFGVWDTQFNIYGQRVIHKCVVAKLSLYLPDGTKTLSRSQIQEAANLAMSDRFRELIRKDNHNRRRNAISEQGARCSYDDADSVVSQTTDDADAVSHTTDDADTEQSKIKVHRCITRRVLHALYNGVTLPFGIINYAVSGLYSHKTVKTEDQVPDANGAGTPDDNARRVSMDESTTESSFLDLSTIFDADILQKSPNFANSTQLSVDDDKDHDKVLKAPPKFTNNSTASLDSSNNDVTLLNTDVTLLNTDVTLLKNDGSLLKNDVSLLDDDVTLLDLSAGDDSRYFNMTENHFSVTQ